MNADKGTLRMANLMQVLVFAVMALGCLIMLQQPSDAEWGMTLKPGEAKVQGPPVMTAEDAKAYRGCVDSRAWNRTHPSPTVNDIPSGVLAIDALGERKVWMTGWAWREIEIAKVNEDRRIWIIGVCPHWVFKGAEGMAE